MSKRKMEITVDIVDDEQNGQPRKKLADNKHRNPLPSSSELRAINEATNLYKNNSFRTQLDSLVQSISPKAKYIPEFEKVVHDLHSFLTSLCDVGPVHPLDAAGSLLAFRAKKEQHIIPVNIPYPVPQPTRSIAWHVAFKAPVKLDVVGSWATKTAFKRPEKNWFIMDLIVEMPSSLFQEKDYRNFRFFHKRAFYLACIAAALSYSDYDFDILYESSEENPRLTNLLLMPRAGYSSRLNAAIRIIPVAADDIPIPLRRLAPSQSNIRVSENLEDHDPNQFASPIYNSTLAKVLSSSSRSILIRSHHLIDRVPSIREALAILKVWGNQRGYGSGSYTVPTTSSETSIHHSNYHVYGFECLGAWWICILDLLVSGEEPVTYRIKKAARPLLGTGLSPYQLFRGVLDFLSKHDWNREPLFMRVIKTGSLDLSSWTDVPGPVFVDPTGLVNILAGVPISSLQLLARDATITLYALDKTEDPFDTLLMVDMREPQTRFDCVVRITLSRMQCEVPPLSADYPTTRHFLVNLLLSTIKHALGNRAKAIVILRSRSKPRSITSFPSELDNITLGIVYDPAFALQLVDHGPSVDSPECEQETFRTFWGSKADLRRFKDGRILNSCVWDDGIVRAEDRESIPATIINYILKIKFGLQFPNDITIVNADYGSVIAPLSRSSIKGRGNCAYTGAINAYENFTKELKTLEENGDLALSLVVTKPCSAALRYMSILPPSPIDPSTTLSSRPIELHPTVSYLPAFKVILQLERSSQWPDDLRAIQRVKMALLERMAKGFLKKNKGCHARIVIPCGGGESGEIGLDVERAPALEVLVDGWAFHAYIWHDREAVLLKGMVQAVNRRGSAQTLSNDSSIPKLLQDYNRFFIHSPRHHFTVLALHHKYPSLSSGIRLVKRWFGAHWVNGRVRDETIELICIGVYLNNACDVPTTAICGFMRVLDFLSKWNGVLYVKLFEEARDSGPMEVQEVKSTDGGNVSSMQIQAGKGSWRIVTLEDPSGSVWCDTITPLISARIKTLAQALIKAMTTESYVSFRSLFVHPTQDYDFLLHLNISGITRYWEGIQPSPSAWTTGYANLDLHRDQSSDVRIEFNPAEAFFRDLQRIYNDVIEFFYDINGGTVIGGAWQPDFSVHKQWKVYLGYSSMPISNSGRDKSNAGLATLNKEAIISEIQRMGSGIIKSISYCNN